MTEFLAFYTGGMFATSLVLWAEFAIPQGRQQVAGAPILRVAGAVLVMVLCWPAAIVWTRTLLERKD
jgi:hypothetical protein